LTLGEVLVAAQAGATAVTSPFLLSPESEASFFFTSKTKGQTREAIQSNTEPEASELWVGLRKMGQYRVALESVFVPECPTRPNS
jgi:hypothetical protein